MFVAKYRKIPVTIQLSNVFWARSNNLGRRGGMPGGGGGGRGAYSGECLRHGPITGIAFIAKRGVGNSEVARKKKKKKKRTKRETKGIYFKLLGLNILTCTFIQSSYSFVITVSFLCYFYFAVPISPLHRAQNTLAKMLLV